MSQHTPSIQLTCTWFRLLSAGWSVFSLAGCSGPASVGSFDFGGPVEQAPPSVPMLAPTASAVATVTASPTATEPTPIICSDAGAPANYWVDKDRDGYRGNTIGMFCSATPPPGFVAQGAEADCDDNDASAQQFIYPDDDGDGHGTFDGRQCVAELTSDPPSSSTLGDDCDDGNPEVFPESPAEVPLDGMSADCDAFDFATSRGPATDQQLDAWAAQVAPSEPCTEGVDLFILHVAYAEDVSCQNCVEEIVVGNRGGQTANVALRELLQTQLISQIALGEITPGGWLRASKMNGMDPGLHEFTVVDARPRAECNPLDNTFSVRPWFVEPGF